MPPAARLGDKARCPLDAHGCPACPHPTVGPAISGSANVLTNGRPAVRLGDPGIHAACCGSNTWKTASGSVTVFINNKAAIRLGDKTQHCGGVGQMIEGSNNVMIGDSTSSGPAPLAPSSLAAMSATASSGAGANARSGGNGSSNASSSSSSASASSQQSAPDTQRTSNSQTQSEPEPDKFTLWIKPDAIRGGAMVGETVHIVDPGTKKIIAEAEVDKDGNLLTSVPENKPYDLNIVGDHDVIPGEGIENENIVSSNLHVALFDYTGQPLAEGLKVIVTGNGAKHEFHTAADGTISPQLPDGVYDVEINGQQFSAHTLRRIDLAHDGGSPFEFQLAPDDSELDYNAIEQARQNRLSEVDEG